VGGDRYFNNLVDVTVLRLGKKAVSEYFGLVDWPHKPAAFDLGDRVLDVLPIPGHDSASIAIYDRKTGILLTGDSLLPGNIYTDGGLTAVRSSNQRLLDFLADKQAGDPCAWWPYRLCRGSVQVGKTCFGGTSSAIGSRAFTGIAV